MMTADGSTRQYGPYGGLLKRIAELEAENAALKKDLERERMRLAACSVVALADTPDSAKEARQMHPDYRSAACDDVARRVDECLAMRAERDALKAAIATAYGHLWHVNNEPYAPIPLYTPEKAAYAARKVLRELLTSEQRGDAINATRHVWGSSVDAAKGE